MSGASTCLRCHGQLLSIHGRGTKTAVGSAAEEACGEAFPFPLDKTRETIGSKGCGTLLCNSLKIFQKIYRWINANLQIVHGEESTPPIPKPR